MDDMNADITQILETWARRQPAAPALHCPGRTSLTYAGLGEQIRYVRERLGNWNIGRGDVVVAVNPLRPEMAVACATLPSAATFAPLSPSLTVDVYCELLSRLRPKALLLPKGLDHPARTAARRCAVAELELVPDPSAPAGMFTLKLGRTHQSLMRPASARPSWAYVLTTSGTTGQAKLVPVTDRQVALYSSVLSDWCALSECDVGCHIRPLHLGGGLNSALMAPWLRGMALICLPESDVKSLFAAFDEYRPTWLTAGFTVLREMLKESAAHREIITRSNLRLIRAQSGRLEPDEVDRIEQLFSTAVLVGLSCSEARTVAIGPLPPRIRKRGSVGLPVCNEVSILGNSGASRVPFELGEILVRGPLVFDGYFDDPKATADAFLDGWFRTGDIGHFDDDGYLFLTGRMKDIVNRGGEKISPIEVDVAIEATSGVREAATFGIPHPSLGEELVAAVVKDGDVPVEASAIIEQVRHRMGPKRVPRRIYFVDQLPRTESGKVHRSELPRLLGLDRPVATIADESAVKLPAPTSPLQAALVGLWSSVLTVNSVGVNDDFFLLGGDSLQGARLLTNVKAVFGVDLSIESLFGNAATVAGMARAIEAARSVDAGVNHG